MSVQSCMLNLRRRHLSQCSHRDSRYLKCKCPLWAIGSLNGKFIRKSLDTQNVERGTFLIREMEVGKSRVSLSKAWDEFVASREKIKGSSPETIAKLKRLRKKMEECFGAIRLHTVSVSDLDGFVQSWEVSPITARKEIERLRSFFKFCLIRKWVDDNPALGVEMPEILDIEVKPFKAEEMEKIRWAIPLFSAKGIYGEANRERLAAFVAVLRWTGMRVRDVVQLKKSAFHGDYVVIRTHKNKKPVKLMLHSEVKEAIEKIKNGNEYLFWSGLGNAKSCVGDWQRSLRRLSDVAGVHIHAHRFRHTFATDLLSNGVPVSEVAAILGNSPRIVEKHYSQWIESRQRSLDLAVQKAWSLPQ